MLKRLTPYFRIPHGRQIARMLFMAILLCACTGALAQPSTTAKEPQKITYKCNNEKLTTVFRKVEQLSRYYRFQYAQEDVASYRASVNVKKADLGEVMEQALRGTNLRYSVRGHFVTLYKGSDAARPATSRKVQVHGVVLDEQNTPLIGVTVRSREQKTGAVTDGLGRFSIESNAGDNLSFSYIGMEPKNVTVTGRLEYTVIMKAMSNDIDDVVVTGYQTVNRRDMVGSYTALKADDIMMPAYSSIDQMLQGRVAGLVVTNSSSRVGTHPSLKLRGSATILGTTNPLWVVDGVVQEDPIDIEASSLMTQDLKDIIGNQISWLNPMDIESVTVLKDASATAVYGSRASNGVIVVTTKKPQIDRLSVNYSANFTINTRPNYGMFNLMNSQERIQFSQDAYNAGVRYESEPLDDPYTYEGAMKQYFNGSMTRDEFAARRRYLETVNTDWFDLLTHTALSQNHNVSVRGGNNRMTYGLSLGYNNSNGQEIGNKSERYTARLSIDANLTSRLRMSAVVNLSDTKNHSFGSGVNPITYATNTSRSIPAYDENGDPLYYQRATSYLYNRNVQSLGFNIFNERDNSGSTTKNFYANATLNLKWQITDWLSYEFVGAYTNSNINASSYMGEKTFYIAHTYRGYDYGTVEPTDARYKAALLPYGGEMFTNDSRQNGYNVQNKIFFSKEWNNMHRVNAMIAMEVRSTNNTGNANTVYGYLKERGESLAAPTYPSQFVSMGSGTFQGNGVFNNLYNGNAWKRTNQRNNFLSLFATLAYTLKDRYVANFTIRNDVSNRFGQDTHNRFDPTYSFGLQWNMADEPWMQPLKKQINTLSLRSTYGIQGNVLTSIGSDLVLRNGSVSSTYNQFYTTISRLPNPDLYWEKTKSWDLGVDMRLFNFFDLTFDYYWRQSNAIVTQELAYEYGLESMEKNGGKLNNHGLEFTASFTPLHTRDWALSLSINASKNWNDMRTETEDKPYASEYLDGSISKLLRKGYAIGSFWSYSFAGLSSEDGRPLFNNLDVEETDPNIDPLTYLVYSGTTEPDFTGGLNLSLRWKSLVLSSSFSLLIGAKKRLTSPYENIRSGLYMPDATVNLNKDLLNRWQKPGDELTTDIPGFVSASSNGMITLPDGTTSSWMDVWANSDALVANASRLRCNQVALTWNLPQAWCSKAHIKSCSLNGAVTNLFVIASSRFHGFDPELDNSVMPKTFTIGLNVGF